MARYKATFQVTVDMEFDPQGKDPNTLVRDMLRQAFPSYCQVKLLKLDKRKTKQALEALGEFSLDEVLPYVSDVERKKQYFAMGDLHTVNMDSHRYFTFKVSTRCVACGLEGTKFLLERGRNEKTPHFNLYAEEHGELVLMTKDHINPVSNGGKNELANYQTMCSICNQLKGNSPLRVDEISALRQVGCPYPSSATGVLCQALL